MSKQKRQQEKASAPGDELFSANRRKYVTAITEVTCEVNIIRRPLSE